MKKVLILLIAMLASVGFAYAGPVTCYGQLQVNATTGKIYGRTTGSNTPVQVKGVSLGWSCFADDYPYFNSKTITALVKDMKAEIIRVPMAAEDGSAWDKGYAGNKSTLLQRCYDAIDAAIAQDVYVVIDWHSHTASTHKSDAVEFFTTMATKYGSYDHVIFEIWNEPLSDDWSTIKSYSADVIAAIRAKSDNLILVGTQGYSQMIGAPADNKINDSNLAYVLHFYAYSHQMNTYTSYGNSTFQAQIQKALNAKLPIFVSEWGTTHSDGGQGNNYGSHSASNSNTWMTWCDQNNISWCAWNVSHKSTAKSAWFSMSSGNGTNRSNQTSFARSDFNESGQYVWDQLSSWSSNAPWRKTGGCAACDPVTVTYNYNYSGAPAALADPACKGAAAVKIPDPKRAGYKFLGWTTTQTGTSYYPFTANLTGNISLYAQWEVGAGPTLVFDGTRDQDEATYLCTTWFGFNDGKGSEITTAANTKGNLPISTTGGASGGPGLALAYKTVASSIADSWGIGFGFNLSKETTATLDVPVDLTGITAIKFQYKGPAAKLQLKVKGVNCNFEADIAASTSAWVTRTIDIETFVTPTWVTVANQGIAAGVKLTAANIQNICAVQFQVGTTASAVNNGSIAIDEITFEGIALEACGDVDYDELLAIKIAEAEALYTPAIVGSNPGEYPNPAKPNFLTAINTAKAVPSTATKDTKKNAIAALDAAITAFKAARVPLNTNTMVASCDADETDVCTQWFSYNDGSSKITSVAGNDTFGNYKVTATGGQKDGYLNLSYDIKAQNPPSYSIWGAGFGFNLSPKSTETSLVPVDLTGAESIQFYHKGGAGVIQLKVQGRADEFCYPIAAHTAWTKVDVALTDFAFDQYAGTETPLAPMTAADIQKVCAIQFQVKAEGTAKTGSFALDEIQIMGVVLDNCKNSVSTAELEALIASANSKLSKATVGTEPGNYPQSAKTALTSAVATATTALTATKQDDIDAAVAALQAAIDLFDAAKIPGGCTETMVADGEDGSMTKFGTYWYTYTDGFSTTTPSGDFSMTNGGANGTAKGANVGYTLKTGNTDGFIGVGLGFAFAEPKGFFTSLNGKTLADADGITFWHKGDAVRLKGAMGGAGADVLLGFNSYGFNVPAHTAWTKVTVTWDKFTQATGWGTPLAGGFDPSLLIEFQWQKEGAVGDVGSFAIDEVQIDGVCFQFKEVGLELTHNAWNDPNVYQNKNVPNGLNGLSLGKGDKVTITIAGTSKYAISNFQAVIADDRNDGYVEKSDYQIFGNIAANVPFSFTKTLTISEAAPAGAFKVFFDGSIVGAGVNSVYLKLTDGTNFDQYTVAYEKNEEGVLKLDEVSENGLQKKICDVLADTPEVKEGDKVHFVIEGTAEENISDLFVVLIDATAAGGYWNELSDWDVVLGPITAGVPFSYEFDVEVIASKIGTGACSQAIYLIDMNPSGNVTHLHLTTFTAEVQGAPAPDIAALNAAISTAENAYGSALTKAAGTNSCANGGQYTEAGVAALASAVSQFNTAITTAKAARTAATQAEVDAATAALTGAATTALNTALTTFEGTKIDRSNESLLTAAIATATTKHGAAVEGSNAGQYPAPAKANYLAAITTAQTFVSNKCKTKADITTAIADLATATQSFDDAKVADVDYSALNAAIALAANKAVATNSCAQGGTYKDAETMALVAAYTAANTAKTATTQAAVTAASNALTAALADFEAASLASVTKTVLNADIASAIVAHGNAVEGSANGQYAAGSKAIYSAKIADAQAVSSNKCALQSEVDAAAAALATATQTFNDAKVSVSITPLTDAIKAAEAVYSAAITDGTNGSYPAAEKSKLNTAIQAAVTKSTENNLSAQDVADAVAALNKAVSDFKASVISVDTQALDKAISDATALIAASTYGDEAGEYPASAKTALEGALASAQGVKNSATLTSDQATAAAADLNEAIDLFKTRANALVKTALENAISTAEALYASTTEGTETGSYPAQARADFQTAINTAKAVLTTVSKNADVLSAAAALDAARTLYMNAVNGMNAQPLDDAITAAQKVLDDAKAAGEVGAEGGQHPQQAADDLQAAINAAQNALDNATSQSEITTAINNLDKAVSDFNKTVNVVVIDKDALAAAITAGEAAIAGKVKGNGDGQYKAAVYDALASAISNGKTTNADDLATQAQVDARTAAINAAIEAFVPNVVSKTALIDLIAQANGLHDAANDQCSANGCYESGSKSTFKTAINTAQAVVDNAGADGDDIATAISNLESAIGIFNGKKIDLQAAIDALLAKIAQAQAKLTDPAVKPGTGNGFYLQSKITALTNAIADAQAVADAAASTQSDLVAAGLTLQSVMDAFTPEVVDKTALADALTGANEKYNSVTYGELDGQKPVAIGTALAKAIEDATVVNTNPQATTAEVNAALAALNQAVTNWVNASTNSIDRSELQAAINIANGLLASNPQEGEDFGQYAAGAIQALQNAVGYATTTLNNPSALQAAIDAEVTALNNAIALFNSRKVTIDRKALRDKIAEALALKDDVKVGSGNGEYPQSAVTIFNNAITSAQGTLASTTATQAQIDQAVIDLAKAITDVNNAKIVVNKDALLAALNTANALLLNSPQGNGNNQYPESAFLALKDAVDAAQAEYDKSNSTAANVTARTQALLSAISTFEQSKQSVSTGALQASINAANDAYDNAIEGEHHERYPYGSKSDLRDAIRIAEIVLNAAGSSQADINKAKADLDQAVKDFQAKQILVNSTALENLIKQANDIHSIAQPGDKPFQYPQEAKDALRDAIGAAQTAKGHPQLTQEIVDNATKALQDAVDAFSAAQIPGSNVIKTDLYLLIDQVTALYGSAKEQNQGGNYKNGSKAILLTAMLDATLVKNNEDATQEEVDQAVIDLKDARDLFLNSTVSLEKGPLEAAIANANKALKLSNNNIGTSNGNYPQEAVTALTNAIKAAEAVLASATEQSQLTNAYDVLQDAIQAYNNAKISAGNDQMLRMLFAQVQSEINNGAVFVNCSIGPGYPYSARTAIVNALESAKADHNKAKNQTDIDNIFNSLQAKFDTFLGSYTGECTDIDEVDAAALRVYPTLATSQVTVSAGKAIRTITVVSTRGAVVAVETPNSNQAVINVATLAQGTYVVRVTFEDGTVETQSIIKQ
ncbi:MAG: cellulase family glycosylhydrolase [Bacteroidales bacterium]|jgi:uncharacterized repeat protein (TIGR02543 family)|nr:cellulase family glycosylhydrolase [Bacteroidales bacterium]